MKKWVVLFLSFWSSFIALSTHGQDSRAVSFDADWRFKKDSLNGPENPTYRDERWRLVQLPHDWSIEDLPAQQEGKVQGPFIKTSIGKAATGYTEGAWAGTGKRSSWTRAIRVNKPTSPSTACLWMPISG